MFFAINMMTDTLRPPQFITEHDFFSLNYPKTKNVIFDSAKGTVDIFERPQNQYKKYLKDLKINITHNVITKTVVLI